VYTYNDVYWKCTRARTCTITGTGTWALQQRIEQAWRGQIFADATQSWQCAYAYKKVDQFGLIHNAPCVVQVASLPAQHQTDEEHTLA
jgi:hypothetical protein